VKYDFIMHGRYKQFTVKVPETNKVINVDTNIICKPLTEEERKTHNINVRGGITVSVIKDGDNLKWGIAKCNKLDVYSKKEGRDTALEMANDIGIKTPDMEFCDVINISNRLINNIFKRKYYKKESITADDILRLK